MSNFQSINDEEIEQDSLVADVNTINSNIVIINNKMNLTAGSNMKTALDANTAKTSFPGFGTSEGTALQGNTTTISSAQATAINSNSQKTSFPGFGSSGGTALEGNTSLLQLGTSSSTALAGDTALLQLGTSSSTALAGDTITISSAQSTAITANTAKITYPSSASTKLALIGITSSVNLNSLVAQSNTNVSDITALENAYPRNTILAWYASQTGNIFFDGNVTFNWDGTNRQLRFFIQNIASNQYVTGGVTISKYPSSGIQISNYLSLGVSTAYKYFTGSQVPANSSYLNTTYNLPSYSRAVYWLQPFSLSTFPSYEISVFVGSSFSWMKIHIKKYNN